MSQELESESTAPQEDPTIPGSATAATTLAPTGRRPAFRNIRRQLSEAELSHAGVQKLLLEELERADGQCETLEAYRVQFHEADKLVAVLQEKLRTQTAVEILFGVGVSLGSAIIGLAPFFWNTSKVQGILALVVGALLTIGALIGRVVKR